ncbi:hypothetical protein JCM10450v2_003159 [Rhodotorula kratochvilovae]
MSSINTGKSAPAASGSTRESAVVDGNTTSAAGSRGGLREENTVAQDEGHTLPNDFRLINTKADGRDGDHTEPNALPGDMASTAGPGGDTRHVQPAEHELKGLKQRLENDDERADREALGYDEPISRTRQPTDRNHPNLH